MILHFPLWALRRRRGSMRIY